MPEYSAILFEVNDHVAHLTLNRPDAANSLNTTVSAEMMDAVMRCEEEEEIRALVIKRHPPHVLRRRRSQGLLHTP
jgi:2-(1,2-epoxy-1,2-dihydrophenyl)acetyl-CoA isomerase